MCDVFDKIYQLVSLVHHFFRLIENFRQIDSFTDSQNTILPLCKKKEALSVESTLAINITLLISEIYVISTSRAQCFSDDLA